MATRWCLWSEEILLRMHSFAFLSRSTAPSLLRHHHLPGLRCRIRDESWCPSPVWLCLQKLDTDQSLLHCSYIDKVEFMSNINYSWKCSLPLLLPTPRVVKQKGKSVYLFLMRSGHVILTLQLPCVIGGCRWEERQRVTWELMGDVTTPRIPSRSRVPWAVPAGSCDQTRPIEGKYTG